MLKDNLFKMPRFMNLCRKYMVESWKTNLLRVGLMYGVMAVIFVWTGYYNYRNMQPGPDVFDAIVIKSLYVFVIFGLICGCISASLTMENMKTKTSRLSVLMTPATPFEKYISRWLVSTVVFLVVFIGVYLLADYTRVLIYSIAYPEKNIVVAKLSYIYSAKGAYGFMRNDPSEMKILFLFYFFIQSCFVLGSSIWPKNALVKTFVAGFVMTLVYSFVVGGFFKLLLGQSYLSDKTVPDGFEETLKTLAYIAVAFFTLLNWALAYYRFKETEIINRM